VLKFFLKGGPIACFSMSAKYAQVAFRDIDSAYSEKPPESPAGPVSCAATLVRRLGLSDMHAVMASGFAGGIGFSGGACGALGAAIWVLGLQKTTVASGSSGLTPPGADALMDRFLKAANYEFECEKIVGRKFESVNDHASYLQAGGCAKIIDALAAQS
jgi:hypothetical protein